MPAGRATPGALIPSRLLSDGSRRRSRRQSRPDCREMVAMIPWSAGVSTSVSPPPRTMFGSPIRPTTSWSAVEDAVEEQRRLVVTSGGHCLEGFVSDPEVKVIVDVSPMKGIVFDPQQRAVMVEAGATVGETFRALAEQLGGGGPSGRTPGDRNGRPCRGRRVRVPVPAARAGGGLPLRRRGGDGERGGQARGGVCHPGAIRTRTVSSGGAMTGAGGGISVWSRDSGSDRPTPRVPIRPRCCHARRNR